MCSGDRSSSANGAMALRQSAARSWSISSSSVLSDWTIRGPSFTGQAYGPGEASAVEAERMAVRIEHHPYGLLRLELRRRRPELDRLSDGDLEVLDLEVEVELLLWLVRRRRPDRADVVLVAVERQVGDAVGCPQGHPVLVVVGELPLQQGGVEAAELARRARVEDDAPIVLAGGAVRVGVVRDASAHEATLRRRLCPPPGSVRRDVDPGGAALGAVAARPVGRGVDERVGARLRRAHPQPVGAEVADEGGEAEQRLPDE